MEPSAPQTSVAIGSTSSMSPEARSTALVKGGTARAVDRGASLASSIAAHASPHRYSLRSLSSGPRGPTNVNVRGRDCEFPRDAASGRGRSRNGLSADPVVDEGGEPGIRGLVVDEAVRNVLVPLLGSRQFPAMGAAHEPAVHHRVRDFRVELQRIAGAVAECLHREGVALGEELSASRQVEALSVPLIDAVGPVGAELPAGGGRADRVIADVGGALRMRSELRAEMRRHLLSAEADAEIGLVVA